MAFLIFQYNSGDCVAVTPHSKKPYGYQDEEVGDGTTSVIVLAGEMLGVAEPLLE